MPFEYAQVDAEGQFFICCPLSLRKPVGNLGKGRFMELWNSRTAKKIRMSILDGSFRFCKLDYCGFFKRGVLQGQDEIKEPYFRKIIEQKIINLDRGPSTINMSYDKSCNLSCLSCRNERILPEKNELQKTYELHEEVFGPHVNNIKRYIMSGSGDPFASKLFLNILRNFDAYSSSQTRIQLSTNGLLLDQRMWKSICNRAIDWVDVSIDAATPETYRINRGGSFDKLLKNLEFLGSLKKNGDIKILTIHFVIQENNFREMKQFVELGLKNDCTIINFKQLINWGTYSRMEYKRRAIQYPEHSEHIRFLENLEDPIFNNSRVAFNDLSHLVKG